MASDFRLGPEIPTKRRLMDSKVFHLRGCRKMFKAFLKNRGALDKDSRLQDFFPFICVGHGGRDIYWIDGRVIHRQRCPMRDQDIT